MLVVLLLSCVRNACVEMCQEYQRWIDVCGSSWEATFPETGWRNIEDCYDDHWDADPKEQKSCDKEQRSYFTRACY